MVVVTPELYGRMRGMLDVGVSKTRIAELCKVDRRTVAYWCNKGHAPGEAEDRRLNITPSAKRQAMDARQDKVIRLLNRRDIVMGREFTPVQRKMKLRRIILQPFDSPAKICRELNRALNTEVSASTVRRDLIRAGKRARRKRKVTHLTADHRTRRVEFAKELLSREHLPGICFSDEKDFDSNGACGWQWVSKGEQPLGAPRERSGPKITVWAAIGTDGFRVCQIIKRKTIDREVYRTEILTPVLPQLRRQSRKGDLFMQDNARPHCGALEWLKGQRVKVLDAPWPALSCDLNPIEQLWSILDRRVKQRGPYGEDELATFVREELEAVPDETINRLQASFRGRLEKVVKARGEVIKP